MSISFKYLDRNVRAHIIFITVHFLNVYVYLFPSISVECAQEQKKIISSVHRTKR